MTTPVQVKSLQEALVALSKGKSIDCGKRLHNTIPRALKPIGLRIRVKDGIADLVGNAAILKQHLKETKTKVNHMSSDLLEFYRKRDLKIDLKRDKEMGGYYPSKSVMINRETHRQKEAVDTIGNMLWGDNYVSEHDGNSKMWATYNDSSDKVFWEGQMLAFAHILKQKLGLRAKLRDVYFDRKKLKEAGDIHEAYLKLLAAKGSKGAKKFLGIED